MKTRVPGTWGQNVRYLWIDKENIMEIHNGKTMLTFLNREKDYKLYDEQNRVVEKKNGGELYQSHYDPVDMNIRQGAERQRKVEEKQRIQQKLRTASERKLAENSGRKGR